MAQSPTRSGSLPDLDPQALYMQLGHLTAKVPDLTAAPLSQSTQQWLGKAYALISQVLDNSDLMAFKSHVSNSGGGIDYTDEITMLLYRALALAELQAPAAAQGAFIPAGNAFDAMAAVGRVLQTAANDALIIDPYMDEKALTEFAVLAPEAVSIRLLADTASHKPSLRPAVTRWITQYGPRRPVEAKLAPPRILHDRLIAVDSGAVWVLTQSLNAFAARSPASIVRVDDETAALKVAAYDNLWQSSTPL